MSKMEPKLLTLNAPTIRNERTLIWLQNQDRIDWSRWGAVVTVQNYKRWSNANIVGIIISDLEDLEDLDIKKYIFIGPQKILDAKPDFANFINLDNVDPYINPWDGSVSDAVAILAILLRYNRVVDCPVSEARAANFAKYPITFQNNIKPNQIWLFSQFFKHKDENRNSEIKECLRRNCECPYIDKIVLINEQKYDCKSNKIKQIVTGRRLTYADFLMYVYYNVPNNVYCILSNADIYFEDLSDLYEIDLKNRMLALLRWDVDTNGDAKIFGPRADSQDTWIFLSDSIKSRTWDFSKFNYQLGQAGCDNAFTGHVLRNKFVITNPSISLKTYHLHNTNIRDYDKKNYIRSDVYINVVPTYILNMKKETSKKHATLTNETVSFEVKSNALSDVITFCTMLEKKERFIWEPFVENFYFDTIPVYKWNDVGVTPFGLVYDVYSMYNTNEQLWQKLWQKSNVDNPLQKCDRIFVIPFDYFEDPDMYILNYVSRCARLLKLYPDTSLIIPSEFIEYIEYFDFQYKHVLFDKNVPFWAKEAIGFSSDHLLGMEDIDALRSLYPSWIPLPSVPLSSGPICTIVIDVITLEMAEEISKLEELSSFNIRFLYNEPASYDALLGAKLCIFMGNYSKLWALPKGCVVVEFQKELEVNGEFQHLAHMCGFIPWILLLPKGYTTEDMIEQLRITLSDYTV